MSIYYILHILTILEAFKATGGLQYYISDHNTFSRDAKHSCTLASPPFKFNLNTLSVGINHKTIHNSHGVLVDGQRFWIGYVKAYTALLYKGCASKVNSMVVYRNMKEDPGLCSSRCQTDFIGLQESTCHCLKRLPTANQLLADGCSTLCTYQPGVLCGNSNYISVYQKDIYPSIVNDQSGNCLSYNQRLSWTQCIPSTKPNRMCQKDDSAAPITFAPETWSQAMQLCIKNETYPVSASNIYLPQTQGVPLWTGQIRSRGILHSNDNTTHYEQGYVTFVNGQFELKFGLTIDLFSICVNMTTPLPDYNSSSSSTAGSWSLHSTMNTIESNVLSTSSKTPLPDSSSSSSAPATSSTKITKYSEPITSSLKDHSEHFSTRSTVPHNTSMTSRYSDAGNESEASKANGSNKVVIYTAIPLSLVVIIGVIVAMLWRRRYLPFCKSVEEETTKSSVTTTTKLELQTSAKESQNNEYVLEPMCLYEPVREESAKDESTETDYDTATPGGLKENENSLESSNVYNKLDIMPTYSHIGGTVNLAIHSDDTYNHIDSKSGENMYDSTTNVPSSDRVNKYSDDTYSKFNKKI